MNLRNRGVVCLVASLVLSLGAGIASEAMAGSKAYQVSTLAWGIHRWQFPPCPARTTGFFPIPCPTLSATYPVVNVVSRQSQGNRGVPGEPTCACAGFSCFDRVRQGMGCFGGTITVYDFATGNALKPVIPAVGPIVDVEALGDTVYASDSIAVNVVRASGNVTLGSFAGELKHDSGSSGNKGSVRSNLTVAVYPDSNIAKADVGNTGVGANFFGKVTFQQAKVLQVSGGFSAGDWVLSQNPDGSGTNVVRPAAGLSKVVPVASITNACVVVAIDEVADDSANVPGASPIGFVVLGLLLAAGAIWMGMARMRRVVA